MYCTDRFPAETSPGGLLQREMGRQGEDREGGAT